MVIAGDTDSIFCQSDVFCDNLLQKIEDLFKKFKIENNHVVLKTTNGHEVIPVKNHTTKTFTIKDGVIDKPIKYIMRHKVSKEKWRLRTSSGKEVICTGDHSLMVLRDGELIEVKPRDINKETDKIITLK